jgi:hypothetical protein
MVVVVVVREAKSHDIVLYMLVVMRRRGHTPSLDAPSPGRYGLRCCRGSDQQRRLPRVMATLRIGSSDSLHPWQFRKGTSLLVMLMPSGSENTGTQPSLTMCACRCPRYSTRLR